MIEPEGNDPGQEENFDDFGTEAENSGEAKRKPAGRPGQLLRMVYEDELRKAAGERALDLSKQQAWIAFRRSLPINRWIKRPRDKKRDTKNLQTVRKELERYLQTFAAEAEEFSLKLDMECNYYKAAVNLLSAYPQGEKPGAKDSRLLRELMILVDYKDARLAYQIFQSIV